MSTAYLTIDDAPSADLPATLEILRDADVPAVFFCEGRRLDEHPEHARSAVEAGFHLGNHADSHTHASELGVEAFREELDRTDALLEDVYEDAGVDRPAKLFRFPYGDEGGDDAAAFQRVLADRGFVPPDPDAFTDDWYVDEQGDDLDWFWTVHFDDWNVETPAELRAEVEDAADRLDGDSPDVVLFHDGGNDPALFEVLIESLRERGIEFGDPLDLVE